MKRWSVPLIAPLVAALCLSFAPFAQATPTKTSPCSGCHTGPNAAVTLSAVLVSANSTTATYTVAVGNLYGMTGWGVFNSSKTKLAGNALASSTFSVPVGQTYTVYGVSGDGAGKEAYNSVSISPVAVVVPAAPVLNATYNTSTGSVTIGWTAVSGATSYDYQVGSGSVLSTTSTSVTIRGLAVGTTTFKVRATNSVGSSAYTSANVVYTLPVVAPSSPVLSATYNTSTGSVAVSWAAVSGATSYDYQVGSGTVLSTTGTSVNVTGLAVGTTAFKVRATNSVGSSAYTSTSIVYTLPVVVPAAPVLNATYNTITGSVTVGWAVVNGAATYTYQVGGGSLVTTSATSVTVGGLAVGTTAFRVRANNAVGSSAYTSANIVYTPLLVAPAAPTLAPSYTAVAGAVTISWPAVPGATSYEYYLAGGPTQTTDTNSVHLGGLVYGTSTLLVRAVNSAGTSSYAIASIVAPAPPAFARLSVTSARSRRVTLKGRVSGVSAAGRVRVALFVRVGRGYHKYVYTAPTSATGGFTVRLRAARAGRAYAVVTAYGLIAKTKSFTIRK